MLKSNTPVPANLAPNDPENTIDPAPNDAVTATNPAARYTRTQPLSKEEKAVQERGYPDVTINTLLP